MVGLSGLEPLTSPLSGVRSSQLSYRPVGEIGGAGRDRTGGLLNANQALSQLSYSPFSFGQPVARLTSLTIIEADWKRPLTTSMSDMK